jgi:hypothetical protein
MVVQKVVTMTLPCATLQLIKYTPSGFLGCQINLPNLTADNQLGTLITFVIANGEPLITASGSGGIYIVRQGTNIIYNKSGGASQITTSLNYVVNNGIVYNLVAIKNTSGVYAWLQI